MFGNSQREFRIVEFRRLLPVKATMILEQIRTTEVVKEDFETANCGSVPHCVTALLWAPNAGQSSRLSPRFFYNLERSRENHGHTVRDGHHVAAGDRGNNRTVLKIKFQLTLARAA